MSRSAVDRLRQVRTFPQLVKYLRDELDWPIEQDSFEDLTFDWDAIELGLDLKTAAKIKEIKQLRPLVSNQPLGIFFVEFRAEAPPGRGPAAHPRARWCSRSAQSAKAAERKAWAADDLLFISAYGEGGRPPDQRSPISATTRAQARPADPQGARLGRPGHRSCTSTGWPHEL